MKENIKKGVLNLVKVYPVFCIHIYMKVILKALKTFGEKIILGLYPGFKQFLLKLIPRGGSKWSFIQVIPVFYLFFILQR